MSRLERAWLASGSSGPSSDACTVDRRVVPTERDTVLVAIPKAYPALGRRTFRAPTEPLGRSSFLSDLATARAAVDETLDRPGRASVVLEELGRSLPVSVAVQVMSTYAGSPDPLVREGAVLGLEQALVRSQDDSLRAKGLQLLLALREDQVAGVREAAEDAVFYFDD